MAFDMEGCSTTPDHSALTAAYEPAKAVVEGMLRQRGEGPFVLTLDRAINLPDVSVTQDSPNVAERDVREVQLVGSATSLAPFIGRRVHVEGTFFHAANVHQSLPVLLAVKDIQAVQ